MKTQSARYSITLVMATFLMGSSFIASKILLRDFAPFWLAGWRFVVAAGATLPVVLAIKNLPAESPNWAIAGLIGLLQTAGTMGLLFLSMQTISAANAAILLFTNPIWVAVLGYFLLNEPLSRLQWLSLGIGLAGVTLAMGLQSTHFDWRGNLCGLGSALCWAVATLVSKKHRSGLHPLRLNAVQMGLGGVVLLTVSLISGEPRQWPTQPTGWAWFLWLAVPASAGSFGLWFLALQRGGAARSSSFLFLAPLFTTVLSVLLLHTTLSGWQAVGGGLVGLSIYLMNAPPDAVPKPVRSGGHSP